MEDLYLGWIEQMKKGIEKWGNIVLEMKPRLIIISGMGGSGVVGDYILALSYNRSDALPVIVVKNYRLPMYVNEKDLVFIISYSGNTLETRHAFYEALKKNAEVVAITSNGVLAKEVKEKNIPLIMITPGLVPRTALPEMLYAVLGVLDTSGIHIVSKGEAEQALSFIEDEIKNIIEEAYSIATFIHKQGGNLVIATHTPLEVLALRGKNEFNENAKIPVKVEVIPEWAHNDIVGWENPYTGRWTILTIVNNDDQIDLKLIEFMESIYREHDFPVRRIELRGTSLLEKLLYGSLLLGLASIKLARIRGLNPLQTKSIIKYKSFINTVLQPR